MKWILFNTGLSTHRVFPWFFATGISRDSTSVAFSRSSYLGRWRTCLLFHVVLMGGIQPAETHTASPVWREQVDNVRGCWILSACCCDQGYRDLPPSASYNAVAWSGLWPFLRMYTHICFICIWSSNINSLSGVNRYFHWNEAAGQGAIIEQHCWTKRRELLIIIDCLYSETPR